MKRCSKCQQEKPLSAFGKWKLGRDGFQRWCKECTNDYHAFRRRDPVLGERERRRHRDRYRHHPEGNKGHLKTRFGLTVEQYKEMVEAQLGLCAICKRPPRGKRKRLAVDHDHESGKARSLLCTTCNTALGHLEDRVDLLEAAISYLKLHGG